MNILKLAKYLSWEFINKKEIKIPDFIEMLENKIDLNWIELKPFLEKYDWISTTNDYLNILNFIYQQTSGEKIILFILDRFWLSNNFLNFTDLNNYNNFWKNDSLENLWMHKELFLKKFNDIISELENSNNNKYNWNQYEDFVEKFLLNSSFFNKSFQKEFMFEIWGQKIDKLLKLNKNILNINNPFIWYTIVEIKFKKDKDWNWNLLSVNEVPQFESYIKILSKNNISKYWIFVCSSEFKENAREKFKVILENENSNNQSFYIALITWKEIKEFLENKWIYENMSFDEFIERSFIKWLK